MLNLKPDPLLSVLLWSSASLSMHIAIGTVWMKSVTQIGAHSQRVEPAILLGQYSETAAGAKA